LTSSRGLSSLKARFLSQDYEGDFGSQGGVLGPLFVGVEGPETKCRTYFSPFGTLAHSKYVTEFVEWCSKFLACKLFVVTVVGVVSLYTQLNSIQ